MRHVGLYRISGCTGYLAGYWLPGSYPVFCYIWACYISGCTGYLVGYWLSGWYPVSSKLDIRYSPSDMTRHVMLTPPLTCVRLTRTSFEWYYMQEWHTTLSISSPTKPWLFPDALKLENILIHQQEYVRWICGQIKTAGFCKYYYAYKNHWISWYFRGNV